ncbi:YcgL domain-containing protein [Echinimonas agarilytica]|uniref:YcgL domain-containing protein NAF29_07095 n=1 Tax=Echinimonas agarilytica TaxID=1215918 RepID=A0AA42B7B6_9GAMM|nr:YcgL domain-containing protein [Echinimonas agarilytica]MCM2679436.1 YcgL domain-containing protein [Echinimonas agarilytica]
MLTAIYKSPKKQETYLYLPKRDDFEKVPEPLLEMFGKPQFVTMLNLKPDTKLALADVDKVQTELTESGYYLQLPPPQPNLLKEHRADLGLED